MSFFSRLIISVFCAWHYHQHGGIVTTKRNQHNRCLRTKDVCVYDLLPFSHLFLLLAVLWSFRCLYMYMYVWTFQSPCNVHAPLLPLSFFLSVTCMHACMHAYIHTYIHTYIHSMCAHTDTDIQTYILSLSVCVSQRELPAHQPWYTFMHCSMALYTFGHDGIHPP
jgi:hypothetical protein